MDVALSLQAARSRSGITQAELAARAGTSQATVSAYEGGRKVPSVSTMTRLLAATGTRLTVEAAERPVVQVSESELARAARSLVQVLDLAEALPTRHQRSLRFPRLEPTIDETS